MTNPPSPLRLLAGERAPGETGKAVQACNDWLRLGPGRTLRVLAAKYRKTPQNSPTDSPGTLAKWSQSYGWAIRAEAYDAIREEVKNAERQRVLNRGLALDYKRLQKLYRLAATLEAELYRRGMDATGNDEALVNLWLADVKSIGGGKFAPPERVDLVRFNAPLVEQLRGVYADIAKEAGGRVERHELGAPGGGPVLIREVVVRLQKPDTEPEPEPPDGP